MDAFPLVRTRLSNELIMAAVFAVLLLYLLPWWIRSPRSIPGFIAVLASGLIIDAAVNAVRYRRPVCAVSAAVTIAVMYVLAPGMPPPVMIIGVAAALLLGKHVLGGTGKNIFNPAIIGLVAVNFFIPLKAPVFTASLLLIPATVLSLPFIRIRPYAAAGFICGTAASLLADGNLNIFGIISHGAIFWGCLVITDPATVTPHPLAGIACGLAAGLISARYPWPVVIICVLGINLISFITEQFTNTKSAPRLFRLKSANKRKSLFTGEIITFRDLTEKDMGPGGTQDGGHCGRRDDILQRIKNSNVFGFGGAGFPAHEKINAVVESNAAQNHLIINGVECDPGLIHDKWLMRKFPGEISKGIDILKECIRFKSVTLAVKDASILYFPEDVKIRRVADYYPVGAEKMLIKEVLGIALSHDEIPACSGILVLNVQTVYAIYEAVCLGRNAATRFITAADMRNRTAQVVKVRLGTEITAVMKAMHPDAVCFFRGGGCMQARLVSEGDVVDKTTNFLAAADFPHYKESPLCSGCGLCAEKCPAGLKVNVIAGLVDSGDLKQVKKLHAERCIGCGSCSSVCLAGRNLSARMKVAREHINI